MKTFGKYLEEKNKGLWDNIHAKRKRGEKMRKPGSKGAPTDADFERSQKESVAEKKLTPAEKKKREEIAKAMERENPGMDMKKKMAIATWQAKKVAEESLDITEISLDMLTKKISNSGMATTKKANKMDKTKNDLAAMKARLAGKPALAKEATEVSELSKKTLGSYVKKAAGSAAGISAVATAQAMSSKGKSDPNDKRQLRNRLTGVSRATDKLTKEEVTEAKRKGAPKMTGDSFAMQRAKDAELNKALGRTKTGRKKPARQMTSTQRSLAQLRNEETQLDEISKKTLGSYVKKASRDVANRSADNARDYARGDRPVGLNKKAMKNWRREIGIDKAVDKMTQEAVQSADKKPEKYVKPDGKVGIRMVRVDKKVVDKDA